MDTHYILHTPAIRHTFRFFGLPGGCTDVLNAFAASRHTHCADERLASEHLLRSFFSFVNNGECVRGFRGEMARLRLKKLCMDGTIGGQQDHYVARNI